MPMIREVFATRSTKDWADSLTAAGVMNAPVQNYGDVMEAEHVNAVDALEYLEHTETGTIPLPHIPGQPRLNGADALTHAPSIGEHSDEILGEWGYSDAEIAAMKANGAVKYPALDAVAAE